MEIAVTSGARRGCGTRYPGAAYLALPLSPYGRPVESYLVDPPQVVRKDALGLAAVGTRMIQRDDGTTHVLDVVGAEHYPTVASFVDEARRLGVSRRIARTASFERLTSESRLLLLHERADVANALEYDTSRRCPTERDEHLADGFRGMCARLWWEPEVSKSGQPAGDLRVVPDRADRGRHRPGRRQPRANDREGVKGRHPGRRGRAVTYNNNGGQLQLLPSEAPAVHRLSIALDNLVGYEHATPSREQVELIATLGLLQPIVATEIAPAGNRRTCRIVEGRRRTKAIAQLAEQGRWPCPPRVDALALAAPGGVGECTASAIALAMHGARSACPASELAAIEAILKANQAAGEQTTIKQIAAQTGRSTQTVSRRLRLRALSPTLRAMLHVGQLGATIAEAATKLNREQQAALERLLQDGERVTLATVREIARERTSQAATDLPDGLFSDTEGSWRATVRGHLHAALDALPAGERDGRLAETIEQAIQCAEAAA